MPKSRVLALGPLLALGLTAAAQAQDARFFAPQQNNGNVYVMSNNQTSNSVAVLKRNFFGGLDKVEVVGTGGRGVGVGTTAPPPDPLGAQNELLVNRDGRWLYAVNAGSDQVSVFKVQRDRIDLVNVVPSGGTYPISLAQRGDALYVLNAADDSNVTAFRIGHFGSLTPVAGSTRAIGTHAPLIGNQPNVGITPAQLQFSHDGKWLAVTVKNAAATGWIELFAVGQHGQLAGQPAITPSADPAPFGFTFDDHNHLLVAEAAGSAVSSYAINDDGTLRAIASSVKNGQAATCWLAANHRFAYTSNTGANSLSGYSIGNDGQLKLIDGNGVAATLGAGHTPIDLKLSRAGHNLYVLSPGTGSVDTYYVTEHGRLVFLSDTPVFPAFSGAQGLAVH